MAVALASDRAYLKAIKRGAYVMSQEVPEDTTVVKAVESPPVAPIVLVAAVVGLLLAGSLALWAHYGTAVFFETIRTGFMACFG
jgi:hypothetical protein